MIVRKALRTLFTPRTIFPSSPLRVGVLCTLIGLSAAATDRFVNVNSANPTPPYTDWTTAATVIQDAIDVSVDGDQVWVTNGLYQVGGKAMAGDLTNRVALDKAITVQSVNGPAAATIQGAGATNGPLAVRCAWLTNGAVLSGFTLQAGATRTSGTDLTSFTYGGGAWCASSNAILANCIIQSNTANLIGGGVYRGALNGCLLIGNKAISGGASADSVLNHCTVISNSPGIVRGALTNCIVFFNTSANYSGSTLSFCCAAPLAPGPGNINTDPQLLADNLHLANSSPCRGAGTNTVGGTDIFGMPWADPPSMGCAEWQPSLVIGKPAIRLNSDPVGFTLVSPVSGEQPFYYWPTRDGAVIGNYGPYGSSQPTNSISIALTSFEPGSYQFVASNALGTVTSAPVSLVLHYADAAAVNPLAPYLSWSAAAATIQDAIDAAAAGDVILVTNGTYQTGGKSMDGIITNRVSVDKAVLVKSVNGRSFTTIQGLRDSTSTNGPGAMRCAWLTNNAILSGFALRAGATRGITPSPNHSMDGGGVLGTSNNAVVSDCLLAANAASHYGGGAYGVTLSRCTLTDNQAVGSGMAGGGIADAGSGGGAASCSLNRCVLISNSAIQSNGGGAENCNSTACAFVNNHAGLSGGGADKGVLLNCTLFGNIAGFYGSYGGAVANNLLTNCIVYGNANAGNGAINYQSSALAYSDSDPLPPGPGNIDVDPRLLDDAFHLAAMSPCIGAGLSGVASGTDIDGQVWANPPSIGCDEWLPVPVVAGETKVLSGPPPQLQISSHPPAGQSPFSFAWLKDGQLLQADSHYNLDTPANLVVYGFGPSDAGAYQFIVSNSYGSVTSAVIQVVVHCVDAVSAQPLPPYSSWSAAAANIQDAIDIALTGEFILVTNGIYAKGGAVVSGDLTNRVALTVPLSVMSLNGPTETFIRGAWDPSTTNGPLAVRCAWVGDGALLGGFALQNGATRSTGDSIKLQSGGGVWAASTNASVTDCLLAGNAANYAGGGCYQGRLYRCRLLGNISVQSGGGSYGTLLESCLVRSNVAGAQGGGSYNGGLLHCTVVENRAGTGQFSGSGIFSSSYGVPIRTSIIIDNPPPVFPWHSDNWTSTSGSFSFAYCCTTPLPSGTGNLGIDPELLDGVHPAVNSPCRGTGDPLATSGTDLDGTAWANPPSMGCYEISDSAAAGPLSVVVEPGFAYAVAGKAFPMFAGVTGWAARVGWSFGDGSILTNTSLVTVSHAWTNIGDYTVTFTAFNSDYPTGVSTNLQISVVPLASPTLSAEALSGTNFTLSFPSQPQVQYFLETAQSLSPPINWQPLTSFYSAGGIVYLTDGSATNGIQFYRVRAQ